MMKIEKLVIIIKKIKFLLFNIKEFNLEKIKNLYNLTFSYQLLFVPFFYRFMN
jgi:hypothetical protein